MDEYLKKITKTVDKDKEINLKLAKLFNYILIYLKIIQDKHVIIYCSEMMLLTLKVMSKTEILYNHHQIV
jgi:hypothetical protein